MTRAMMRPDTESPGGGPAASRNPEPTMTTLLTEQETSALLRISVKGLQSWRYRGGGPKFLKLGRTVRYRRGDLQDFVLKALRSSTSDPGPGR